MSVKEILQGLVDDGMVDTDKIGTSVYFWAFPSKAGQNVILGRCIYLFKFIATEITICIYTLQCFDAIGWAAGSASGL